MRVLFRERYGAWWPGADPTIDDELALRLIAEGLCTPYGEPALPIAVVEPVAVDEPTELEPTLPPIEEPTAAIRRGRKPKSK